MTLPTLAELRRIALAATPGPYRLCHHLQSEAKDGSCPCGFPGDIWGGDGEHVLCSIGPHEQQGIEMIPRYPRKQELLNAAHIAAFNPETAIALLDRIEELESALELIASGSVFQDAQGERNCIAAARAALAPKRGEPRDPEEK